MPANADAQVRWKHYLFRAFAGRHLLTLTAAAGTPAEHKALGDFHAALGGLLPRVCRSGGLGGAPVPMSDEDALLVEEIDRNMQYALHAVLCCVACCDCAMQYPLTKLKAAQKPANNTEAYPNQLHSGV